MRYICNDKISIDVKRIIREVELHYPILEKNGKTAFELSKSLRESHKDDVSVLKAIANIVQDLEFVVLVLMKFGYTHFRKRVNDQVKYVRLNTNNLYQI